MRDGENGLDQEPANLFCVGQIVNNVGFVGQAISVTATHLCLVVWKPPQTVQKQMGMVELQKNLTYGHSDLDFIYFHWLHVKK